MRSLGAEANMAAKRKPKAKPDDPAQSKRFEETARELGSDEKGKAFKRALKSVVKPKRESS